MHTLVNENRALVLAVGASVTAQLLKVPTHFIRTKKLVWSRAWGAGGLPSSHSAMVTALATTLGYRYGFDSGLFAVAAVFSLIVLYDAMGIRQAVGQQGRLLNRIVRAGVPGGGGQDTMAELVGHTFWEVLVGVMWGIFLVVIFY